MGSGGIVPLILKLDTRWPPSRPARFTPDTQCTDSWFGPPETVCTIWKGGKSLGCPGIGTPDCAARSQVCLCFPDLED